ncbi:putative N-acetyltransferase san, partial [Cucurbita argyrosperma subsp. sororia]
MGEVREVSISLDGVRDKNLMQLKKLNTALFPVRYNEKYYADVLASGEFTKLVYDFEFLFISIASLQTSKPRPWKLSEGWALIFIVTFDHVEPSSDWSQIPKWNLNGMNVLIVLQG